MKRVIIFALLGLVGQIGVWGQPSVDCPGWKNTTSFNTGNPSYKWTARVGERTYNSSNHNDTTTGYHVMSTCVSTPDIIGHANITSSTYNSGSDMYVQQCGHTFFDANDSRFQIITNANAGIDQFTVAPNGGTGMPRICPGYTTSVRLGDMRNTGNAINLATDPTASAVTQKRGAEALFYTMMVTPMNALLFINYAVVARRYSHSAYDAGEFLIRVVKQNDDGTWPNEPINDSLWYKVSAPTFTGSEMPLGWEVGAGNVNNWPCTYAYKPWSKVAISLNRYLYDNVRIEMYTSDCIYSADPIYAYIAGDYQPMKITSSGCADERSDAIDTLRAPEGLTQYRWYAATMGPEEDIYNGEYMDGVHFRVLTQPSDNNFYMPTVADFVLTEGPNAGDTVSTQTFMCTMVSALDPHKPFTSKIYANLENSKPTAVIGMSTDCNLGVQLTDESYTFASDQIDPDSTRWIIYGDSIGSVVLDTLWGRNANYQFPTDGYYLVSMRTMIYGKSCSSVRDRVCRALQGHEVPIALEESVLCEGETARAWSVGGEGFGKVWSLDDSVIFRSDATHPYDTISFIPVAGNHIVSLTTTTDGQCPASTAIALKVIGNSTITSNVDASLICRGDSVTLSALGIEAPRWVSVPFDSSLVGKEYENVVTVAPQVTTTYTVQPTGDSRCLQNASDITILVLQYPVPTIWTSRVALELTNPSLHIEDRSPNSTSSQWRFSDGYTDEGPSIDHYFGTSDDSVWIALHACNEMRCCADTTVWLPVQVNAMWIPNTFTPNLETNNRFTFFTTLGITYYEIWIYNRQGLLVYHGDDINQPWDGKDMNGNPCPQGAYVYHYAYSCTQDPERRHIGDGTVTLLR